MTINVEIVLDSVSTAGARITTFLLQYPRMFHSEVMTHRCFSRNAMSSRAVPVRRMIELVEEDLVVPMEWVENRAGMQGGAAMADELAAEAEAIWRDAAADAVRHARRMAAVGEKGVHKQYANRILEPYQHIKTVLTGTDFDNFYALRYHPMAFPEFQELAKKMYWLQRRSHAQILKPGEWHLPFTDQKVFTDSGIWRSVASCARTSYLNHDKKTATDDENKGLYDRLLAAQPIHASPAEHQAAALVNPNEQSGNFRGWRQYRKLLTNECVREFKPLEEEPCAV